MGNNKKSQGTNEQIIRSSKSKKIFHVEKIRKLYISLNFSQLIEETLIYFFKPNRYKGFNGNNGNIKQINKNK